MKKTKLGTMHKDIIWEQVEARLDKEYRWQRLVFVGQDKFGQKYQWETLWTFEAMDDAIDMCVFDICQFMGRNF